MVECCSILLHVITVLFGLICTIIAVSYYMNNIQAHRTSVHGFFITDPSTTTSKQQLTPFDYSQLKFDPFCDNKKHNETLYLAIRMIASSMGNGIGNRLFEIFALRGMARRLNRTAIFIENDIALTSRMREMNRTKSFLLRDIEVRSIEPQNTTRYPLFTLSRVYQYHDLFACDNSQYLVLDGNFFQSYKYFSGMEAEIRELFEVTGKDRIEIGKMVKKEDEENFKTCIHIRRGDFHESGRLEATNEIFTVKSIDFLVKKHGGVVYIFNNDVNWVDENVMKKLNKSIKAYNLNSTNTDPIYDLYFSRLYCDSVLITAPSSTFGWWLAYLAKSQIFVYYRDIFETSDMLKVQMINDDYFLPGWNKMGYDEKENIVIKPK